MFGKPKKSEDKQEFDAKKFWDRLLKSKKGRPGRDTKGQPYEGEEDKLTNEEVAAAARQVSQLVIEAFEGAAIGKGRRLVVAEMAKIPHVTPQASQLVTAAFEAAEKRRLTVAEVAKILHVTPNLDIRKAIIRSIKVHLDENRKLLLLKELIPLENRATFLREGFSFVYLVSLINGVNCSNVDFALQRMYQSDYPRIFEGKKLEAPAPKKASNGGFLAAIKEALKKNPEPTPELTDEFVADLVKELFRELTSDNDAMSFIYKIMKTINAGLKQDTTLNDGQRKMLLLDPLAMYVLYPNRLLATLVADFPDDATQRMAIPINAGTKIHKAIHALGHNTGFKGMLETVLIASLDSYWSFWRAQEFEDRVMLLEANAEPSSQLRALVDEARGIKPHVRKRSSISKIDISEKHAKQEELTAVAEKQPKQEETHIVVSPRSSRKSSGGKEKKRYSTTVVDPVKPGDKPALEDPKVVVQLTSPTLKRTRETDGKARRLKNRSRSSGALALPKIPESEEVFAPIVPTRLGKRDGEHHPSSSPSDKKRARHSLATPLTSAPVSETDEVVISGSSSSSKQLMARPFSSESAPNMGTDGGVRHSLAAPLSVSTPLLDAGGTRASVKQLKEKHESISRSTSSGSDVQSPKPANPPIGTGEYKASKLIAGWEKKSKKAGGLPIVVPATPGSSPSPQEPAELKK